MRKKLRGKCKYDNNQFDVFFKSKDSSKLVIRFDDNQCLIFNFRHRNSYAYDELFGLIGGVSITIEHNGQPEFQKPVKARNGFGGMWESTEINFGTMNFYRRVKKWIKNKW